MTPKLYKAADVCEIAQVQPYVLRSWEKEFPGIGVQKSPAGPRLYRQSDLDQVLRIKQLVFEHGLTLSGAKRKLDEQLAVQPAPSAADEEAEVLDALASDARTRIAHVRDGLRSILALLSQARGPVIVVGDEIADSTRTPDAAGDSAGTDGYELAPPRVDASGGAKRRTIAAPPASRTVPTKSTRTAPTPQPAKRRGRASA